MMMKMMKMRKLKKKDFTPSPDVETVMVSVQKRDPPLIETSQRLQFDTFVQSIISAWQPSMAMSLKKVLTNRQISKTEQRFGRDIHLKPSEFGITNWLALFAQYQQLRDRGQLAFQKKTNKSNT